MIVIAKVAIAKVSNTAITGWRACLRDMYIPLDTPTWPYCTGIQARHGHTHDHDLLKAFALVMQILGNFVLVLVLLSGPTTREGVALATVVLFSTVGCTILLANAANIIHDLVTNKRPVSKNKEAWLVTISKTITAIGVVSFYIGDNLPEIQTEFSDELGCDDECTERGLIAGLYLLYTAVSTFMLVPGIFRRISEVAITGYDIDYIRKDIFNEYHVQYFIIRMLALVLDLNVVYTSIWVFAFIDIENCDTDELLGTSFTILTAWAIWTLYGVTYIYYLSNVKATLSNIISCKLPRTKYRCLYGFYYAVLILFFVTFFPINLLSDNVEPLSCGCVGPDNTSLTTLGCEAIPGVLETRVAFFSYQVFLLAVMGVLGAVKSRWKETKN